MNAILAVLLSPPQPKRGSPFLGKPGFPLFYTESIMPYPFKESIRSKWEDILFVLLILRKNSHNDNVQPSQKQAIIIMINFKV
jgi:hypothetical protein